MPAPGCNPRILLVRFGAIGDLVLTTPLIRALRQTHPSATIVALTKPAVASVLADSPHLDALECLGAGESLGSLARRLRKYRFTHLLDLHGVLRSLLLRLFVPGRWFGYSKRRVWREVLIRFKRDVYRDDVPEAERFFEAARALGVVPDGRPAEIGISEASRAEADTWWASAGQPSSFIALAPGAAHFTKQWPLRHWQQLADDLVRAGRAVVVVGGSAERELGAAIVQETGPPAANACGALGLQGSAALIARAKVLVSGDTGLMHIAAAVGTPVVALFGPTVRQFGFLPYRATATVLEHDIACRPCSKHGGPVCPLRHHACMEEIGPARVRQAIEELAA